MLTRSHQARPGGENLKLQKMNDKPICAKRVWTVGTEVGESTDHDTAELVSLRQYYQHSCTPHGSQQKLKLIPHHGR